MATLVYLLDYGVIVDGQVHMHPFVLDAQLSGIHFSEYGPAHPLSLHSTQTKIKCQCFILIQPTPFCTINDAIFSWSSSLEVLPKTPLICWPLMMLSKELVVAAATDAYRQLITMVASFWRCVGVMGSSVGKARTLDTMVMSFNSDGKLKVKWQVDVWLSMNVYK